MAVEPSVIQKGDILYYLRRKQNKLEIRFGLVDELRGAEVILVTLMPNVTRKIDDFPTELMHFPTRWKKLPKGWTWDTKLFQETISLPHDYYALTSADKDGLKDAVRRGILIPSEKYDNACYESEIDKTQGWRIIRRYPNTLGNWVSVFYSDCYSTYEEAVEFARGEENELHRQADLSDYDWSVEQIDRILNHFAFCNQLTDLEVKRYRDWILAHDEVENIEIRQIGTEQLQFKYWYQKRWVNIEI